jgi:hypothetical protein
MAAPPLSDLPTAEGILAETQVLSWYDTVFCAIFQYPPESRAENYL